MTDHIGLGDVFWDDSFRLALAEGPTAPVSGLGLLLGRLAARDAEVRFEVPKNLSKTELEISRGQQTTRIPVDLRDRRTIPQDGSVDRFGLSQKPLLVNSVVGFIGPEYLYDGKEIIRAGLEDHFCGKLLGLPLGVDVCYTNHAEADQDDMDNLLTLLAAAGVTFIMGVPGADDVMLNYQSTSFHDALYVRDLFGLKRAPEFDDWLVRTGLAGADFRLAGDAGLLPEFASRLIA